MPPSVVVVSLMYPAFKRLWFAVLSDALYALSKLGSRAVNKQTARPVSSGATSKFGADRFVARLSLVLAFPLGFQASDMTTYKSWLCRDADIWTLLSHWQHDVFDIRKLLIRARRLYAI